MGGVFRVNNLDGMVESSRVLHQKLGGLRDPYSIHPALHGTEQAVVEFRYVDGLVDHKDVAVKCAG